MSLWEKPPHLATQSAESPRRSFLIPEILRIFTLAFLIPLLPSLLWWLQMRSSLHFRGWVNAEYILLLCIALLAPSLWTITMLVVELTISLVEPIAHLYYFSPSDAVISLQYLNFIPAPRLAGYAAVLLLYIGGTALLLHILVGNRQRPVIQHTVSALILIVLLLAVFDIATGRPGLSLRTRTLYGDTDMRRSHVVRTPVLSLLKGMSSSRTHPSSTQRTLLPSAFQRATSEFDMANQPDIVLVVVESWGAPKNILIDRALTGPSHTSRIEDRYRVETGTVPFLGGTTSGETRELCGDSHGRSDFGLTDQYFTSCWPAKLAAKGYRTLAVHGFTSTMYHRKEWYTHFGFAESDFLPELERDRASLCDGAFPGACDADVATWIGNRLTATRGRKPMFVHWVSLNSHLPVAPVNDVPLTGECQALGIKRESSLCAWFDRVLIVQNSIARLAAEPALRPTVFIVVGDHAPPFLKASQRDQFSQIEVPYLLLIPKATASPAQWIAQSPSTAASRAQQHP